LLGLEPGEILSRLADSGLRGRGGGWFPAARKWNAVRVEGGRPVVVANGAEGEPGSLKDRYAMLTRPADVLRGLRLAARALGADEAIVYLKGSFSGPLEALRGALAASSADGPRIRLHRGEDGYVAGEETALIESLEGRRAWPRPKPPLPAAVGLFGQPTLVQNVETLARVPAAVADPAAFRAGETTLVSLWGDVRRPGVYERRLGTPLRALIEEDGGGATDAIGWLFPSGPSAAPLPGESADLPLDPDVLRGAGSGLGTASLLVVGAARCPLSVACSLADFFERESCAQCPPCSVGSASLAGVLRRLEAGAARPQELRDFREAAGFMSGHGYCAHSRSAAASLTGLLRLVPQAVEAHLAARGCPRHDARFRPFDPDAPERAALEDALARQLGARDR
jgi:NADH-quinone oxidoreductase subunit F